MSEAPKRKLRKRGPKTKDGRPKTLQLVDPPVDIVIRLERDAYEQDTTRKEILKKALEEYCARRSGLLSDPVLEEWLHAEAFRRKMDITDLLTECVAVLRRQQSTWNM